MSVDQLWFREHPLSSLMSGSMRCHSPFEAGSRRVSGYATGGIGFRVAGRAGEEAPVIKYALAAAAMVLPMFSGVAEAAPLPLAGKVVLIDPGHNGQNYKHPGMINKLVQAGPKKKACDTTGTATNSGYTEHAFTIDVARRLYRLLKAEGAKVVVTRSNDRGVGPCINQRAAIGNKAHADAAISIHGDGAPASGHGFHVILPGRIKGWTYNAKILKPSRRLGLDVRDAFAGLQATSNYLGVKGIDVRTDLGGLNMSTVPKVFIECGNMRNSKDATRMRSAAWRQRAAKALAAGLTTYLNP
jgi:N-acetylmuramoyl-L-alanine amidase